MPLTPLQLSARTPGPEGIDVADQLSPPPAQFGLTGSRLVLFIHGYNNTHEAAEDSYVQFRARTGFDRACPAGEVCFFHWPGNHRWGVVSFASYPVEIAPAKKSAKALHDYLTQLAAVPRGGWPLEVTLVCHSLGNRLGLELMKCIADAPPNPQLRVTNFCLMAAAVPTFMVEPGGHLLAAARVSERTLVLHSRSDPVLHYAFPSGQTVANFFNDDDEGFFPTAIGRDGDPKSIWTEPPYNMGTFDYGHSDYWTGKDHGESTTAVAEFLGTAVARHIPQAVTPTRPMPEPANLPTANLPAARLPSRG